VSSSRVPYDHAEYQNKFRLFSGQNQIKSKIYHQVMWCIWWNNSFLGIFLVLSRIILADSRGFLRFSRGSLSNDRKWKNSCIKMDSFKKNFKIFATYFTTGRIILNWTDYTDTKKIQSLLQTLFKQLIGLWLDCWKWPPLLDDLLQVEIVEIFYRKKFWNFLWENGE